RVGAMKTILERMICGMVRANGQIVAALGDYVGLQCEILPVLAHVLATEHIWLARLQNGEPCYSAWPRLTLPQCATLAAENSRGYTIFLGRLSEADLTLARNYSSPKGEVFATLADLVTRVVIHGAYHHCQILRDIERAAKQAAKSIDITGARARNSFRQPGADFDPGRQAC